MQMSYTQIADYIWNNGAEVAPRGVVTHELLNATLSYQPITIIRRHKMNTKLAWLESLMMVGGIFDISFIAKVAPAANLKLYEYQSDYGVRVFKQLLDTQRLLTEDPSTRRAVLYLNDRDTPGYNCACTTSIQFLCRDGMLHTTVNMRSWDFVFGMPMDIIMFGFLASCLAASLELTCSNIVVNAASAHIYEATYPLAKEDSAPYLILLSEPLFYNQPIDDISRYCRWESANLANGPSKVIPFKHSKYLILEPTQFEFSHV